MSRALTPATDFSASSNEINKNLVKVENDDGRLRLRFTYGKKRYAMAVGLPDSPVNRIFAQRKANQIELDIISGNFDSTLKKYKPLKAGSKNSANIHIAELFEKFIATQTKAKNLQHGSLCRYNATLKHLKHFFVVKPADKINSESAEAFVDYLRHQVCERTVKDYLILVKACWDWSKETLKDNPWSAVLAQIKPSPKQKVKPFTVAEVKMILDAFGTDRYYCHYADFVAFLFGTGCRFGEAVALQWKHIADDYSSVWIGESVSRGVRKTTKTGKDRTIMLTQKISKMISSRKSMKCDPEDLVFPAPKGDTINDHSFRRRA